MKNNTIISILSSILIASILFHFLNNDHVEARSYFAEAYNVEITIQPENQLLITETLIFSFQGGPYTYAFRELGSSELDSLQILNVTMDGITMPYGNQAGQVEVSDQGDSDLVTWHFPETSDQTRIFTVTYQVNGGIRREGNADLLLWQAIPGEHEYEIHSSTITVTFPPELTPYSGYGFIQRDAATTVLENGTLILTTNDIADNDPVSLRFAFPAGSLITEEPVWQQTQISRLQAFQEAFPAAGGAAFVTILFGIAACFFASKKFISFDTEIIQPGIVTTPPKDIPPVLGALLVNNLTSAYNSLTALLIELGQRGWVNIEYVKGGLFRSHKFFIHGQPGNGEPLMPHQRWLMDLIQEKSDEDGSIELQQLFSLVQRRWDEYNTTNQQDAIGLGWVNEELKTFRHRINVIGIVLLFGSLLAAMGLAISAPSTSVSGISIMMVLIGGAIGLTITGLIITIFAQTRNILTQSGQSAYEKVNNFRKHLASSLKTNPTLDPVQFEEFLPYVTALGLANRWTANLQKSNIEIRPAWLLSKEADAFEALSSLHLFIQTSTGYGDASGGGAAGAGGGGGSSGAG